MEFWFERKAELKGQTNLKLCCLELFFFQKNGKQLVLCEDWKEIKYESTIKRRKKKKSFTPITASMLLAKIHNPASRGSPMTFQLPYHVLQHQEDGCTLSVCYFISLKKENLDGQPASEILLECNCD